MRIGSKNIDPIQLWSNYCEIKDEPGPFLTLTFCPNPDHDNTRSPAFQINVSRPTVHCFSHCGISGNYDHAICVIEGIYDKENITDDDLERARIPYEPNESREIKRSRSKVRGARRKARKIIFKRSASSARDISSIRSTRVEKARKIARAESQESASKALEKELKSSRYFTKEALAFLEARGIDESSRTRWKLGFDETAERVIIPAIDTKGRLQFLIKRGIHRWQRPAYLYPAESEKTRLLFGACNLDRSMVDSQGLILVEGSIDCIKMHQHGYRNTVAILGNKISKKQKDQIVRLRPKRVYLLFDKDAGGITAIQSAFSLSSKYQVKVPLYPKSKEPLDPAKLSSKQIEKALRRAVPLLRIKQKLAKARREASVIK